MMRLTIFQQQGAPTNAGVLFGSARVRAKILKRLFAT